MDLEKHVYLILSGIIYIFSGVIPGGTQCYEILFVFRSCINRLNKKSGLRYDLTYG